MDVTWNGDLMVWLMEGVNQGYACQFYETMIYVAHDLQPGFLVNITTALNTIAVPL